MILPSCPLNSSKTRPNNHLFYGCLSLNSIAISLMCGTNSFVLLYFVWYSHKEVAYSFLRCDQTWCKIILMWFSWLAVSNSVLKSSHNALLLVNNFSTNIYLLRVNDRNTRKRYELCSKLTIKSPERRHLRLIMFLVNVCASVILSLFSFSKSVALEV